MNEGLVLTKYTGARGKSSASDANAEFVAKVCRIMEDADVKWQCAELGRIDIGGGGTIACFLANMDVEEEEIEVVRTKTVLLKPETVDEAILQMNLIGHMFYMFRNAETDNVCVVYRRNDGGYGLIEPDFE
jgi:1-aminocyclopropane-1-carboxylate deaminase/D-cysteine desulfhydrase-like pyridoxal-dependent ACC family enzyme